MQSKLQPFRVESLGKMILELIEDYQKTIINPETPPELANSLVSMVKHLLDTHMHVINAESAERRKIAVQIAEETEIRKNINDCLNVIRERMSNLESQNQKLLESIEAACPSGFETIASPSADSSEPISSEHCSKLLLDKIQVYRENNVILETMRREYERVILGGSNKDGIAEKVEELQIQIDSVVDKLSCNIGYNYSLIEQLHAKYTMLVNKIQEMDTRTEGFDVLLQKLNKPPQQEVPHSQTSRPMASEVPESVPYLKRSNYNMNTQNEGSGSYRNFASNPHDNSAYYPARSTAHVQPKRNKEKYNKNKERNELREIAKKQLKEMLEPKDKKE